MSENRINVIDIIEKIKNGNDNAFDGIQIKDYLPIATKRLMCEEIAKNSIVEQNGMKIKDSIAYGIAFDLIITSFYSNVDIDEHYDEACEYKIIDFIKENMNQNERDFISEHSYHMIRNELEIHNSLVGVINRNLTNFINIIEKNTSPKAIKSILKEAQKLDLNKLPMIKQLVETLDGNVVK
jgi:hypothetical protein